MVGQARAFKRNTKSPFYRIFDLAHTGPALVEGSKFDGSAAHLQTIDDVLSIANDYELLALQTSNHP